MSLHSHASSRETDNTSPRAGARGQTKQFSLLAVYAVGSEGVQRAAALLSCVFWSRSSIAIARQPRAECQLAAPSTRKRVHPEARGAPSPARSFVMRLRACPECPWPLFGE